MGKRTESGHGDGSARTGKMRTGLMASEYRPGWCVGKDRVNASEDRPS